MRESGKGFCPALGPAQQHNSSRWWLGASCSNGAEPIKLNQNGLRQLLLFRCITHDPIPCPPRRKQNNRGKDNRKTRQSLEGLHIFGRGFPLHNDLATCGFCYTSSRLSILVGCLRSGHNRRLLPVWLYCLHAGWVTGCISLHSSGSKRGQIGPYSIHYGSC